MDASYKYLPELKIDVVAESIVSRVLYHDDRVNVTLFAFDGGQELSEHTASNPAIIQILKGTASITLGTDKLDVESGAWIHMSAGLAHSISARTPLIMLLTLIKQRG